MPIVDRLDWIARQVTMGRDLHISLGAARDEGKLKVRFTLAPPSQGRHDLIVADSLNLVMQRLRGMAQEYEAMDCGHRHSDGTSIVSVWMRPMGGAHGDHGASPASVPRSALARMPRRTTLIAQ